jgi:DNA mismatch repair ATPase MutS
MALSYPCLLKHFIWIKVYRIEQKGALLQECKNLVLTPGMNLNIARPQGHANNYLMSVVLSSNEKITWGIAYADLSTGYCS